MYTELKNSRIQHKQAKKYMRNVIKHAPLLLSINKPSNIHTNEIIFNQILVPFQIKVAKAKEIPITIAINNLTITIKQHIYSCSFPYHLQPETWTKMELEQSMNVLNFSSENITKPDLDHLIYYSMSQWKLSAYQMSTKLGKLSLKQLLQTLNEKIAQNLDGHQAKQQESRPSILNNKFSQRTRSYTIRHKIASFKKKQESLCQRDNNSKQSRQIISSLSKKRTIISTALRNDPHTNQKNNTKKRISNVKITQNQNQQISVFYKKQIKLRDRPQIRIHQQPPLFQDNQQLIQMNNKGKARPKFYEQVPFTHQQIELKRKRFDSQFIPIKPQIRNSQFTNDIETEQSQVTEDICKEQQFQTKFQDTFERGMEPLKPNLTNQESGTLCQSVFE